jgi:hypothetical protein
MPIGVNLAKRPLNLLNHAIIGTLISIILFHKEHFVSVAYVLDTARVNARTIEMLQKVTKNLHVNQPFPTEIKL